MACYYGCTVQLKMNFENACPWQNSKFEHCKETFLLAYMQGAVTP